MHDDDVPPPPPRRRPPRRWPALLAVTVTVAALALTGLLAFQDRQNAEAASNSSANAARDAVALASLGRVSRAIALAKSMEGAGILGLQTIGVNDFQSSVVAPLGGTLVTRPGQWTLALGGGWACLTWAQENGAWGATTVTRGVCNGAPIVATPSVSATTYDKAVLAVDRTQRAAVTAAFVTAAMAAQPGGRIDLAALARRFAHLARDGIHVSVTPVGVTVRSSASDACLRPAANQLVRITLGPCT